jgi:HSP20 family protein
MATTVTRWDPARNLAGMQDEFERLLGKVVGGTDASPTTAGAFSPALDVEETDDGFAIFVELPGVAPEDVELTLEENILTITGERHYYDEQRAQGMRRVERRFGRFHRAVRLPDRVQGDLVIAEFHDGLLTVRVPKSEDAKPRRIAIQAG